MAKEPKILIPMEDLIERKMFPLESEPDIEYVDAQTQVPSVAQKSKLFVDNIEKLLSTHWSL